MKLVRPLSTVENTRYARVFHSRQWSMLWTSIQVLWSVMPRIYLFGLA